MEHKTDPSTDRTVYRCQNDFGPLNWRELPKMIPKIADFGLAVQLAGEHGQGKTGTHPIQPDHYRAPEVILGCEWSFSADIWNIGVLVRIFIIFLILRDLVNFAK